MFHKNHGDTEKKSIHNANNSFSMSLLAPDVRLEIFRMLSPEDLQKASLVSKEWSSIISGNRELNRKKRIILDTHARINMNSLQNFEFKIVVLGYDTNPLSIVNNIEQRDYNDNVSSKFGNRDIFVEKTIVLGENKKISIITVDPFYSDRFDVYKSRIKDADLIIINIDGSKLKLFETYYELQPVSINIISNLRNDQECTSIPILITANVEHREVLKNNIKFRKDLEVDILAIILEHVANKYYSGYKPCFRQEIKGVDDYHSELNLNNQYNIIGVAFVSDSLKFGISHIFKVINRISHPKLNFLLEKERIENMIKVKKDKLKEIQDSKHIFKLFGVFTLQKEINELVRQYQEFLVQNHGKYGVIYPKSM